MAISLDDNPTRSFADEQANLSQLITELGGQLIRLAKQEFQLAKTELKQQATRSTQDGILVISSAVVIYTGLLALVVALIAALSLTMPIWQAATSVGVVMVLVGGAGLYYSLGKLRYDAHLEHLPASLDTNGRFLKENLL